jgi:outer membrane receptor protein involved in Fe transport
VITAQQAAQLPILSRNISHYLTLIPGAVSQSGAGTDNYSSQTDPLVPMPNIGSVPAFLSNFSVDGISNVEDGTAGWVNSHVNPDAISEVKVLSNNYSAEYGRNAGAVVNAVTKSGGQSFHGLGYTYWRHEQFNSTAYFDNQAGIPKAGSHLVARATW